MGQRSTGNYSTCTSLSHFEELLLKHEQLIAHLIKLPMVSTSLFPDYKDGITKSLGGWGGDFMLVTGTAERMDYFKEKGYTTIIPYQDMIL